MNKKSTLHQHLFHEKSPGRPRQFFAVPRGLAHRIIPLVIVVCISLLTGNSYGQIASNYGFSASVGNYTPLTGGTAVGPFTDIINSNVNNDDGAENGIPIGFAFNFCGVPYNTIGVDINGFITLSTFTTYSPYWDNDFPSEGMPPQIAGFWDDMYNTPGTTVVSYTLTGNAGSQVFTLEFANLANTGPGSALTNFEIKLYQGTNVIQMCYGSTTVGDWDVSGSIGIANSFTDWLNVTNTGDFTTPAVSSTSANDDISVPVPNGTIFTFTPPPPCVVPAAAPTALSLTPGAASINGGFTASSPAADGYLVVLTTTATPPDTPANGTTYTAGSSALGGTIVAAGLSTSFIANGLTSSTQYWLWVYPYTNSVCTGGPIYLNTNPLNSTTTTTTCSMAGTYVVGPSGDYNRIADAIAAITLNGQTGPIVLEVQTTYTGETNYPVVIGAIPCASATNNLTIRPQGTLTISGSSATELFDLNGAQYVTIDGRVGSTGTTQSLTISNTNTGGGTILFINDASNDAIQYCTLQSVYNTGNTTNNNGTVLFSTAVATGNDNDRISNCNIIDGATTPQVGIMSLGTTGMENDHDTVVNCNIANYFSATGATDGVLMSTGTSDWAVMNNKFYQTATRTFTSGATQRAIYINNTSTGNNFTITGNTIGYASSAGTGTYTMAGTVSTVFQGIYFSGANTTPSSIQGNTITNISLTSSSTTNTNGGFLCGIYVPSGSANVGTITPNTIGAATGNGAIYGINSGTGGAIVGISTSATSPAVVNIENNIIGAITDSGTTAAKISSVEGIQASSSGKVTISGNSIGSATTAKSMNAANVSTATAAQLAYGINASTSNPDTITNNTIANLNNAQTSTGGLTSGILYSGSGAGYINSNTINSVSGASANTGIAGQTGISGIAYTGSGAANISQNVISTISATNTGTIQSNVSGIGISTSANGIVQRNKIYDLRNASTRTTAVTPPTATGILCGAPGTGGQTITNNFISIGSSQTTNTEFVGIMSSKNSNNTLRIYYNSIDIEGTATSGALPTIGISRGDNSATAITASVDIKNNLVVNNHGGGTGENYAIANDINATASTTGWGTNASNYNILNATNTTTIGYWGADQTFAAWKTSSASDTNSYSAAAVTFTNVAAGDLHINMGTTPNYIESHATPLTLVTTDYDNDSRPGPQPSINGGGTAPDIGADEFDGTPIDNLPPTISYTALLNTCGFGDLTFSASVVDSSAVPLTGSGTEPRVYYKKDVNGTWFSRAASLLSGTQKNGTWNFVIVASDMGSVAVGDTIYYYVIAQDNLGNVGSNPAAGLVASNVNTVTTPPTTPNYYQIAASLGGTYTVGAAGNYPTITAAANAYSVACLTAPVVFQLTDTAYPNETFPIIISDNAQASATNTLTIEPAPGVAVNVTGSSSATSIFKLLNAQYVTIDGLNTGGASLALTNTNTGNNTSNIWLASTATTGPGCNFITLHDMTLTGGSNGTTSDWNINASVDGANPNTNNGMDNDNVTVRGNTMTQSGYALYVKGTAAVSAGGLDNWVIDSNIMGPSVSDPNANLGYNGMFLQDMVNASVTNNTIQNVGSTSSSSQCVGIYLASAITGIVIDHNTIDNVISDNSGSGTTTTCAMELNSNVVNSTISRNTITGISDVDQSGYGCRGIIVNTGTATGNTNIVNNMISDITSYSDLSTNFWPVGIDIEGSSGGVNVYFNSVNLFGPHIGYSLSDGPASACLLINTSSNNINVEDNIFANTYVDTTTSNYKGWSIYSAVGNSVFSSIDYNDYYATAPNVLANIGGTDETALPAIQSGFGGNTHSLIIPPFFVAPTNLHLQVVSDNVPLIAGTPQAGITTDLDGTTRSLTTPVIGAHEVAISGCYYVTAGTLLAARTALCATGLDTFSLSDATQASGLVYQWQSSTDSIGWQPINGATSSSYDAPLITTTTYFRNVVTCTNSGLNDSASVKVQVNLLPVISVTPNSGGYCSGSGGSVTMTASGASTYVWSPATSLSSTSTASVTANPLATVVYTVTGTDTNGCKNTNLDTVTVTNTPLPVIITPNVDTFCSGTSVMLTAVSAPPDSILVQNFNSGLGTWTVDNTGSTDPSPVAPWTLHPSGYVSPEGDTYTSPDNSQFISTNSDNGGDGFTDISYLTSPTFSLAGYNSAILTFQQFHEVEGNDNVVAVEISVNGGAWTTLQSYLGSTQGDFINFANASIDMTPYLGQSGLKIRWDFNSSWGWYWAIDNVAVTGTSPNYTITWAPGSNLYNDAGLTVPYTTGTVADTVYATSTAATQTTTTYTATAANGACTDTGTAKLTVVPALVVETFTGGGSYCVGSTGVSLSLSQSTAGIIYQLNNNSGAVGNPITSTGSAINFGLQTTAGTYYVTATNGHCTSAMTDSAVITINPLPSPGAISGTTTSVCADATITLTDTTTGGTWTSVVTGVATVSNAGLVTGVAAGTDTIKYAVTNGCGTTTVDTIITVNPLPAPGAITGIVTVCANASVTLADTTANGTWSSVTAGTATVSNTGVVTGIAAGTDTIKYAVTNGCGTTTVDTVITVNPLPTPTVTLAANGIDLSSGSYTTYQWFLNGTAVSGATNANYTATANGSYTVEVTDANGCTGISTAQSVTQVGMGIGNINSGATNMAIYPNPNTGTFVVSGSIISTNNVAQMEIVNVAGQVISRDNVTVDKGQIYKPVKMDASLAAGMYYVRITSDQQIFVLPFIKQ